MDGRGHRGERAVISCSPHPSCCLIASYKCSFRGWGCARKKWEWTIMALALLLGIEDGFISTESWILLDSFFGGKGRLIVLYKVDCPWDFLWLSTGLFGRNVEAVWWSIEWFEGVEVYLVLSLEVAEVSEVSFAIRLIPIKLIITISWYACVILPLLLGYLLLTLGLRTFLYSLFCCS